MNGETVVHANNITQIVAAALNNTNGVVTREVYRHIINHATEMYRMILGNAEVLTEPNKKG